MAISMYEASAPVFTRMIGNLRNMLVKADAHAKARGYEVDVLVESRLAPDMFPLRRQVQIASDAAKGSMARLAGRDVPSWDDTETTMAQLIERLDKTLEYLAGFSPDQVDGSEERQVVVKTRMRELRFTGLQYLQGFAVPNLYFHVVTSYNILRHNGVELGKMDFLGGT
ncbi:DUF1993 domain-containing protein [Algiphilus sp. W345]|uniref:DUF1993 domain-containing protein n=1 Tax=Banduia mediterranea TaxID=3075609 RepID=A0ABU2WMM0_9GAMM|nr:DUF1993 domain-containing protein [Algiphilus sp. W345]MDT0498474.1 DUF1993 domain-containing protein [Algiphilus sp. W345]